MITFTPTSAAIEDAADTPTGRDDTSRHGSSGARMAHYQELAILTAAIEWHEATEPTDIDAACEALHRTVGAYLSQDAERYYAHRLLDQAVAR